MLVLNRVLFNSLIVFIAGSCYGFIVPAIKSAAEIGIYPHTFVPLQYLVAFLVCLAIMLVRRIKWASPKNLAKLALLGVFTGGTPKSTWNAENLRSAA